MAPSRRPGGFALSLAGAALAIAGCRGGGPGVADDVTCDARLLESGEVRIRRIPCDAELAAGGEARRGDHVLENEHLRLLFRHPATALTLLETGGGTLLDAAPYGGTDLLVEAVPLVEGAWLADVTAVPEEGDGEAAWLLQGTPAPLHVLGAGGAGDAPREVRWRLRAGEPFVTLEGAEDLWIYPQAGVALTGSILHLGDRAVAVDGVPEDTGGGILFRGATRLAAGSAGDVMAALWPGGLAAEGTCDGVGVEVLAGEAVVGWLPVGEEGAFGGTLPAGADGLRAVAEGWEPGPVTPPGTGLHLVLGEDGRLPVRVAGGAGEGIAALLHATGVDGATRIFPVPPEGARVPVGPGTWDLVLSAGPLRERAALTGFEVRHEARLEVALPRPWTPEGWLLADLEVEAWRSGRDRTDPAEALARVAAQGVGYAVATATDEVGDAALEAPWDRGVRARTGSRAESPEAGSVAAWPWSANSKKQAHSAADWRGLGARDLLAAASGGSGKKRLLLVDRAWVAAAGPPWDWDPRPDLVRLDEVDDLSLLLDLLDAWTDVGVAGPWTWVAVDDPARFAAVEVEQGLVEARTVATSGPFLGLAVAGRGPGESLVAEGSLPVEITVHAPPWMALETLVLVVDGAVEARWDLAGRTGVVPFQATRTVESTRYVLAATWGDEDPGLGGRGSPWAVTGPVWTGAPGGDAGGTGLP